MASTDNLGKKLFALVQDVQGWAFISDDVEDIPDEEVLKRAQSSLEMTLETAARLTEFIEKHKE